MNKVNNFLKYNTFESKILKRKCGTLILKHPIKVQDFHELVIDLRDRIFRLNYDFVTLKIHYHKPIYSDILREYNFKFIEELITFYLKRKKKVQTEPVFFKKDKLKECIKISKKAFIFDRYHQDKFIGKKMANDIKTSWIKNSFEYRADKIFGLENNKGFLITKKNKNKDIFIDLIAVDVKNQNKGYGRRLIEFMLSHYSESKNFYAGTQKNNKSSTIFYKKNNFKVLNKSFTYHWHAKKN